MKTKREWLACCAAVGLALAGFAEVDPGENILLNGMLEADQVQFPQFWLKGVSTNVTWHASGGPRPGTSFVRLASGQTVKGEFGFRQSAVRLAVGGRYRYSAWVRTKDVSARKYGIVMVNNGWRKGEGVGKVPADTDGKWVKVSGEFTGFASDNGQYVAIVYAVGFRGQFDVADIRLEAIDEIALGKTERSAAVTAQKEPRLLPYAPLLCKIPAYDPAVTWRFLGKLPKGVSAGDCRVEVEAGGGTAACPLAEKGDMRLALPAGAREGVLAVRIVRRDTGEALFADKWRFAVVDIPKEPTKGRRLNNLCTELVNRPIAGGSDEATVDLTTDGWIYARIGG